MENRPNLDRNLDGATFCSYYYLKKELVEFCKKEGLQATGGKLELISRIAKFLDTKEKTIKTKTDKRRKINSDTITKRSIIEDNFICSQKHREFFKQEIGKQFSFCVEFQNWLKSNSGKTYEEAINIYYYIKENKKTNKTVIGKQFEYNTYIREFFSDNKDKTMKDAIKCWNYKKNMQGSHHYEKSDLQQLKI